MNTPFLIAGLVLALSFAIPASAENWPSFRGAQAAGIEDGGHPEVRWDVPSGKGVKWQRPIPGLGLSAPIVWGNRLFVTTAVPETGDPALKIGLYGDIESADDMKVRHEWKVFCIDKTTGAVLWEKTACAGLPAAPRHPKSSHANCTPVTDGKYLACFFGGNGLYVFDLDGNLKWKKDFGPLRTGYYKVPDAQWGFASSPVIHDGKLVILCDVLENSFLTVLDLATGNEVWKVARADVPTFSTPTVAKVGETWQIFVNGYRHAGAYDFATGRQIWKMMGGGDIPVPAPVISGPLVFLTSAHGELAPVTAIDTTKAAGEFSRSGSEPGGHIAWRHDRRGNYMQTPIAYRDHLWCCHDSGVLSCYKLNSGEIVFTERLFEKPTGCTASGVAADGNLFFPSEQGEVVVVEAKETFRVVSRNALGAPCLASPAISDGVLFFRTKKELVAILPVK